MKTNEFLSELGEFYGNGAIYKDVCNIFINRENIDLTGAYEQIKTTIPCIELLGEFFLNLEEKEYKKIKLDKRTVNNNIPYINVYQKIEGSEKKELSPFFKEMREKLYTCKEDDYTLEYVILTIFEEFVKKHNELATQNETNKKLYELYYNVFNKFSFSKQSEKRNNDTIKTKCDGFVYIASCATENVYKIGMSKYITDREKTLRVGNHYLTIFAYTKSENPRKLEILLHNIYATKNLSGEWFELTKDELDDLIQSFCFNLAIEENDE